MIQLNTVAKHYSEAVHIGPVSLELPRGGITALVGPNGAGKSTLLTMIGRLLGIDEGTITVGGADVSTTKSKELAKILSILRQENHFVSRLTVRQLVAFGRFPHSHGHLNSQDEDIITRYVNFLGLDSIETRYLDQLSGGQRQRAYVAMVIVLHDINFAARYATRIVALKDGTVAYQGTPEEIMTDQVLTDVFDTPVHVIKTEDGPLASYF